MADKIIKCTYCKEKIVKSQHKTHLEYEHGAELRASLQRMKVALPIILVSFSIVLGMVFMDLIK